MVGARESERRDGTSEAQPLYRCIYERTPAMMHTIDASWRIIGVSDMWLGVLGFGREEVIGRRSGRLPHPRVA